MSGAHNADRGAGCLVVGYDRTQSAHAAIDWAARELPDGGKLVIVHACRALHAPASPLLTGEQRHELGRAVIDELLLEGDDGVFDLELETVISERDPVSALIEAANRHEARMIVLGCERHSAVHKALGTVTSELMGRSPVPVTVIGPAATPRTAARPLS